MTSPLRRIDRAKEHLDVLNAEVDSFITGQPYRATINKNVQENCYIIYPYLARQFSPMWGLLIGELAHGLRSALDNIAWSLAIKRDTTTNFPVFLDRDKNFVSRLNRLRDDIRADIEAVQPYKAPQGQERRHPLWVLQTINNIDKHRLILPGVTRISVATGLAHPKYAFFDGFTRLNKGDVELRMLIPPNTEDDFKPEIVGQIGFDISSPIPSESDNAPRIRVRDLFSIHHFVRNDVYPRFAHLLEPEDGSS